MATGVRTKQWLWSLPFSQRADVLTLTHAYIQQLNYPEKEHTIPGLRCRKGSSFQQTAASLLDLTRSPSRKNTSNSRKHSVLWTVSLPRGSRWLWNKFKKMGLPFVTWGNWKSINKTSPPTHANANSHEQVQVEDKKKGLPRGQELAACRKHFLLQAAAVFLYYCNT